MKRRLLRYKHGGLTVLLNKKLLIWVDPLDGTKQYIKDYSEAKCVTILIGIVWHGRPIAGVINQPFHRKAPANDTYVERIIWGIVGLGSFIFKITKIFPLTGVKLIKKRSIENDDSNKALNFLKN